MDDAERLSTVSRSDAEDKPPFWSIKSHRARLLVFSPEKDFYIYIVSLHAPASKELNLGRMSDLPRYQALRGRQNRPAQPRICQTVCFWQVCRGDTRNSRWVLLMFPYFAD